MRSQLLSFSVLLLATFTMAEGTACAAAPAGSGSSSIRILAAPTPAAAAAPVPASTPQQTPEPREAVVPPQPPLQSVVEPQLEQPEFTSIQFVPAAPPARRAELYPVRQAIHTLPSAAPTPKSAQATGRLPLAVNVYSSPSAQATLSRMPRPMTVQSRPKAPPARPRGKPFQSVESQPAISPYLNLYRRDVDANNLPNYFAFVRPQLEQQQANRQRAAELQELRGQLQNLSSPSSPPNADNRTAHARYMDTAQYFGGLNR
jgi:hypothetical protein